MKLNKHAKKWLTPLDQVAVHYDGILPEREPQPSPAPRPLGQRAEEEARRKHSARSKQK